MWEPNGDEVIPDEECFKFDTVLAAYRYAEWYSTTEYSIMIDADLVHEFAMTANDPKEQ